MLKLLKNNLLLNHQAMQASKPLILWLFFTPLSPKKKKRRRLLRFSGYVLLRIFNRNEIEPSLFQFNVAGITSLL